MPRSMRRQSGGRRNMLLRSNTNERLAACRPATRGECSYFPLTRKFGTYFQSACDSISRLRIELAPKQLDDGKVPRHRARSARKADDTPQRGLITQQSG